MARYKLIEFENGTYGIRKSTIFGKLMYYNFVPGVGDNTKWYPADYLRFLCKCTTDKASALVMFHALTGKKYNDSKTNNSSQEGFVAVGPDHIDTLDPVTGKLKLL